MSENIKRVQPAWQPPKGSQRPVLRLYNSLTRKKEVFVPQEGKRVTWYSCGPTVYDSSHMGHARSYITFDILRRVMRDYFKYDIIYAMNITDIDDKIIKRARQRHLLEEYKKENLSLRQVLPDATEALQRFAEKLAAETDPDKKAMLERLLKQVDSAVDAVEVAMAKKEDVDGQNAAKERLLRDGQDVFMDWLDKRKGHEVTDNSIFSHLPKHFETEFLEDMDALHVEPADVLTRVSEYIPEVVEYVQRIIDTGFGYEAHGSVYFDTNKFSKQDGHYYAKLVPEAFGDMKALYEGEGDLSISEDRLKEKNSANDFALWKTSKPGEPSWDSPWGKGRPGWHIECSVMASSILGESFDIHTGGSDLKFPHHDNELAQAEACFGHSHWVRYFCHAGHLNIDGCKMSKSLKNFISIKEALKKHSACQLRLAFLLHSWKDTLDYSSNTMAEALSYEKVVNEFFLTVKDLLRRGSMRGPEAFTKWGPDELDINDKLLTCQENVYTALCDSIDTKSALDEMKNLVGVGNVYISKCRGSGVTPNRLLMKNVAAYVTKMLQVFGAIQREESIGFPTEGATVNVEETVMPYLTAFADFRENVRKSARELKATAILRQCDEVRDDILPDLGVRLEDHEGQDTVIKLVNRETLMKERQEKIQQEEAKRLEKERKKAEQAAAQAAKDAQKRISPLDMFRQEADKYSQFDDKGMPTHDAKGEELKKSQLKKLTKLYEAQAKRYQDYQASLSNATDSKPQGACANEDS